MNLLLVDDDAYVLEAVKNTLDWKQLQIENVYTAQSVRNAKRSYWMYRFIWWFPILKCHVKMDWN